MPLVGTAGHVDHGKSTLVAALTGRDPDRWAEEKERGLTIDLGFAWTDLDGVEVSFVDVPGHERFLKNMLAGIDPIDVALFVVAADEGWSAQSEEHLAVLDLLGIRPGVVALTKSDRVDGDLLELAALEIAERLEGTSLEAAEIVPVSAISGDGIDELRSALGRLIAEASPRSGPPTLWVDRSFSVAGAGTVVTGSLSGDAVRIGDELVHLPDGTTTRVRTIQSHEQDLEVVGPGRRVALGVPDLARDVADRGTVLTVAGVRATTSMILADLRPARGHEDATSGRGAFHVHMGSGDWPVQLRPIDGSTALLDFDAAIATSVGERFIVRDAGRRAVVAGGRVLHPFPPRRRRRAATTADTMRAAIDAGRDAAAQALLETLGTAPLSTLAEGSGGGTPSEAVTAAGVATTPRHIAAAAERALDAARAHQAAHPLREGIPKAELADAAGIDPVFIDHLIAGEPALEAIGSAVAADGHRPRLTVDQTAEWERVRSALTESGFGPPRASELLDDHELAHALIRRGDLVQVDEFLYLAATLDGLRTALAALPAPFTVSEAKDALGISRKHAVPLMEWCDATALTRRSGDGRVLRD
ncbi:MAG: selenocysteine-specific translation elongation factor [Acidimicrobiia bacterium]|nr:selenocysteine-specific translation elongation factor [Acidimicrobiia bacterium]